MGLRSKNLGASPPRALVIGAGPAAQSMHLPVLARLRDEGEIVLCHVCDISREPAAIARRKFGFFEAGGDSVAGIMRPDIDVVYIFGSAQLHYEYGLMALQSGKHLFVEKPVAPSFTQACEMASAAQARGRIAAGGHNRRFYRSLEAVRARAGKAGWRFAEAVFHKPEFGKLPLFGAKTWLGANGIHALDGLIYVMGGLPDELTALAGEAGAGPASAFSAIMRWSDGAQAVFLCNNNAGARREEYAFHCPGETCRVSDAGFVIERDGTASKPVFSSIGDGVAAEHKSFLQAIRSGIEPLHSIAAISPSLFLAELIESGFSGAVKLPGPEKRPLVPQLRNGKGKSIVVVNPGAELQMALPRTLADFRIVALEDVLASAGPRTDVVGAILGRGEPALPQDVLEKLPNLTIVGVAGLSLARHEPEALLARGIILVNASAAYAESVAEFALALAILGRRRAFVSHEIMRTGGWGTSARPRGLKGTLRQSVRDLRPVVKGAGLEPLFLKAWKNVKPFVETGRVGQLAAHDLAGATVGLIGWGANAQAFARRLTNAGARVLVCSQHASARDIEPGTLASLGDVLAADIVSLHRGLTDSTRHFLGAAELARLRPGAVLINVARGALIDPDALLARLKQGDIFACLDTYEDEPPAASHPLRHLPNVFLTSHIAGGSPEMHAAAAKEVVQKVIAFLEGGAVESISTARLHNMT